MQKRKNHLPTWFEIQREQLLNLLEDLIFLQNIQAHIGFKTCMRLLYILTVMLFCYMTITAFYSH